VLPLIGRFRDERGDELDPELAELFAPAASRLDPDDDLLRRAEARLSRELDRPEPVAGGGLRRRLAFGAVGGGALWAGVLGTAAAHKAVVVAVGVGLLLGGGVAAETTGVGETVRETLGFEHNTSPPSATPTQAGVASVTATGSSTATSESTTEAVNPSNPSATIGPETQPGGKFVIQATLLGIVGDALTLEVDGEQATVMLSGVDAVHVPGPPVSGDPTAAELLEAYAGRAVVLQGTCNGDLPAAWSTCVVDRVQVLGGPASKGSSSTVPPARGTEVAETSTPAVDDEGESAGGSENADSNGVGSGSEGPPGLDGSPGPQGQGPGGAGPPGQQDQGQAGNGPPEQSNAGGSAASEDPGSAGQGNGNGTGQGNGNQ
jgi:hypothetical protein